MPCSSAASVGSPRQPSGSTKHDTSRAVSTPGSRMASRSVTMRGLRCNPFSTDWKKVMDTASAAIRGSTTPTSRSSTSCDSSIGEWAEGTSYRLEIAWVSIASTPPHGLTMLPSLPK